MIKLVLIIVAVSYLLGSIPFGYLLVRIFRGEDVRHTGSGNIGATNVARTGSKWLAIATLVLDALKGYLAVFIAGLMARSSAMFLTISQHDSGSDPTLLNAVSLYATLCALAALVAIIGHMFPVWLRFKGGKGVATAAGAFGALAPRAMLLALVAFAVVVAFTRYVSLGSIVAAAVFPFFAWWNSPTATGPLVVCLMGASSLLIIARHKSNIRRLLTGTESRFR